MNTRTLIAGVIAAIVAGGILVFAIGDDDTSRASTPAATSETYNRSDTETDAFEMYWSSFAASLRLDICDAAEKDGAAGVAKLMQSEDWPWEINDLHGESRYYAKKCGV